MNTESLENADFSKACLSVRDLKQSLASIHSDKKIFAMTQCYSGGFHQLSVERDDDGYYFANPNVCGFSATTEDETASGCTPNVDGPHYQGYERYLAEALTGIDVVTGKKIGEPAKTLSEAHYHAAAIDQTNDVPLSTSDYFLRKWASTLENDFFVPRTDELSGMAASLGFELAANDGISKGTILKAANKFRPWFEFQYKRMDDLKSFIKKHSPQLAEQLELPASELEEAAVDLKNEKNDCEQELELTSNSDQYNETDKLIQDQWYEHQMELLKHGVPQNAEGRYQLMLTLAWEAHRSKFKEYKELKKQGSELAAQLLKNLQFEFYEKYLIQASCQKDSTQPLVASHSMRKMEKDKIAFVKSQAPLPFAAKVAEFEALNQQAEQIAEQTVEFEREYANLRRILIIKRTIAAAFVLILMDDQKALSDFQGLLDCEANAL